MRNKENEKILQIKIVDNILTKQISAFIAVYIYGLVTISIERSETNKKRALEIRDKLK